MTKPKDHEVAFYQDAVSKFRNEQFNSLTAMEKLSLIRSAEKIKQVLVEKCPTVRIALDDLLDLAIIACYFRKYGQSPISTAVNEPR